MSMTNSLLVLVVFFLFILAIDPMARGITAARNWQHRRAVHKRSQQQ
jgi:hypothetical protein